MNTLQEIKDAISHLHARDRTLLDAWLHSLSPGEHGHRVEEPAAVYGTQVVPHPMTVEEYLRFENESPVKHEYVAGEIFAMSGPSLRHNIISGNIFAIARNHLRGNPCKAFMAEVRVRIADRDGTFFYYPDLFVACGRRDMERREVEDPKLVIEVLSPSTERTDRWEKFINYRLIPTLEEYVLVSQSTMEVTFHRRGENWVPHALTGPETVAHFQSIDLRIALDRIYEGVD